MPTPRPRTWSQYARSRPHDRPVAIASGNRLLPLLAGIVVLMLGFVALRSCSGGPPGPAVMDAVPQAPVPDADTPADTIKTLTANVAAMTAEVEALRRDGDRLRNENRQLLEDRARVEEDVMARVRRELLSREHKQEARRRMDSGVLSSLTERVDALSQSLSRKNPQGSDIPVGLGFEGAGSGMLQDAQVIWVDPLDARATPPEPPDLLGGNGLLRPPGPAAGATAARVRGQAESIAEKAAPPQPAYTVPRNATLIDSTALTALVGRVPVQGQVRDPMPFKVITGSENLAANGFTVPGVRGMVWSGTAIGDWTLSCVTGRLDSVTFVFDDGTIRTISGVTRSAPSASAEPSLGWISDRQGIPCISGARKTNAPAFLTQRIGMTAVQAAADAVAAAQTTTLASETGAATDIVTGNTGAFVFGKTVAGGSEEVTQWLMERQSQSFDAVFVPAGTRIAIHVDRELPIDLDPEGRKLDYAKAVDPYHRTRLD